MHNSHTRKLKGNYEKWSTTGPDTAPSRGKIRCALKGIRILTYPLIHSLPQRICPTVECSLEEHSTHQDGYHKRRSSSKQEIVNCSPKRHFAAELSKNDVRFNHAITAKKRRG